MKKLIFIFVLICAGTFAASAQSYKSAIGLRLGYPTSISFKQFLSERNAIELFVGYRRYSNFLNFVNIGGLYQVHNPISDVEGLAWYYGGGATVFFWNYDDAFYNNDDYNGFLAGYGGLSARYTFR